MKSFNFTFFILFLSVYSLNSQNFIKSDEKIINGYLNKIEGTDFKYHSFIPDLTESLLIRATTGRDYMEWETDAVKAENRKKYFTFIWVAAIGSSPGIGSFDLTSNISDMFTFYSDGKPDWEIINKDGSELAFHKQWTDQHGDHHGYMCLKIEADKLEAGQKVRIKISGGKSGLTSWYMTYKQQVKTSINIKAFPATIKDGGKIMQLANAGIFYFGDRSDIKLYSNNKLILKDSLHFGHNYLKLKFDPVVKSEKIRIKTKIEDKTYENYIILEPVKKWEISFIQHSHTDIGYTRSQTEILAEHLRYIDFALDYCDATDSFPENAKFRWTCEASWAVDEYIKTRPESQIDRLKKRIKEGRIEVTAMYFNLSELPDEQTVAASLEPLKRFRQEGIPVKLAMQNDVNGIAWCLNDYFKPLGVKYLNMGTHGHRALICFDKPTLFWWESPSGNRLLTFRAEHYMTGNTLMEMVTGDLNKSADQLLYYLINLEKKGYPYNEMAIQFSGYTTDNSPPSTIMSEMIRKWNEIYESPKLLTSTATAFFEKLEKKYASSIPVYKGYWPDWWADGLGASAREVAAARNASSLFTSNTAGLSMAILDTKGLKSNTLIQMELAQNALLFYGEHTTGYSESVREPFHKNTMEQRALKDSYAWEAYRRVSYLGEEALGILQSSFSSETTPTILAFNTLSWLRTGLAAIYIDHQLVPNGKKALIQDAEGNIIETQAISHRSDGTYWAVWLKDIPAFGFKKFYLRVSEIQTDYIRQDNNFNYENNWYKIQFDQQKGVISSIFDKKLQKELLDQKSKYKFGEFIHEQLANRSQVEMFTLNDYKRNPLESIEFEEFSKGDIWDTYKFIGKTETLEEPRGFIIEFRIFKVEKRIDVNISIVKKNITDPESIYISFPIDLENAKNYTETAGGIVENGKDQIPGSSADWALMQSFTSIRNSESQIVLNCNEMPLIQLGNINIGRFRAGALPESNHIYSWPMNNYWTTNFNADQRGGHNWTYSFTSGNDKSNTFSTRFGWNNKIPLLTRVLPGGGKTVNKDQGVFISGFPDNVVLTGMIPIDQNRIKMQIRELEGRETFLELKRPDNGEKFIINESDVNGDILVNGSNILKGFETKFFVIDLKID
jgi:alpha-mannosidase